nr:MAG TPA: hypothetical protein [Caudoviricetes sp.]
MRRYKPDRQKWRLFFHILPFIYLCKDIFEKI